MGIHGQWIWVDRAGGLVLVKLSSRPEPSHDPSTMADVSVLAQIARALS
jgi:CubicO group peptidase (beta-lactamase class C family)